MGRKMPNWVFGVAVVVWVSAILATVSIGLSKDMLAFVMGAAWMYLLKGVKFNDKAVI